MLGWKGFISSKCTKGKLNGIVRSEIFVFNQSKELLNWLVPF